MLGQILYALPFLAEGFALTLWVSLLVVVLSLIAGVLLGVGLVYGPALCGGRCVSSQTPSAASRSSC
ncbi:hypothetical protein ACVDG5_023950 [Mesorhizobium sp. ORM6]